MALGRRRADSRTRLVQLPPRETGLEMPEWTLETGAVIDTHALEDLAQRLARVLPPGLGPVRRELESNFHAVLQSRLPELGLVGREEFEAAREMLAHSRRRIDELEARVRELEGKEK